MNRMSEEIIYKLPKSCFSKRLMDDICICCREYYSSNDQETEICSGGMCKVIHYIYINIPKK